MATDNVLKTIIAEGAGEGEEGMYAIASSIVNRATRRKLTLEQVVNQPKQFTGRWRKDLEVFVARQGPAIEAQARRALERATRTPLPGVDHYLTRTLYDSPQRPSWAKTMGGQRLIGNHVFLDSQPTTTRSPTQPGGRMPTLDQMKLEGPEVHEKISKELYRMDQNVQAMGLGPMTPEDLRYAYGKIKSAVMQLVNQQGQKSAPAAPPAGRQTLPPPAQAPAPAPNLPLSTFAEGGLVNDVTGQGTQDVRNRLGIR